MTVTIKDVAKLAGVSPSTVSRVMSNHPKISIKTVRRVKKIMDELGYHPNIMAKSLVSKTTNTLALLLPKPAEELLINLFFSELIRGIVTQSNQENYDLLMTTGASQDGELEAIKRLIRGRRVDGVILLYSRKDDQIIHYLREQRFPFVLIGRSADYSDILSVDNDNVQAAYDATQHLIEQGHEKIGFVSGPHDLMISQDRFRGYQMAMLNANLPMNNDWLVEGEFIQESGYNAMSQFMNLDDRPTAVVVIDDIMAFGVIRALRELGYRIPRDLGLVSFNNVVFAELSTPPISSVDIGIYQLGYTASQRLIQAVKKDEQSTHRSIISHSLKIRESSLHKQ
jgi:DNA-binding LacI/PurR family transcriptional regulator